jgi:hypothetical protein
MSKHWAPDLDQIFIEGETTESRRAALEAFVLIAREGDPIPPLMLAFVAEGVSRYLEGDRDPWPSKKGRPTARPTEWQTWAAWFAVRCDPQFAHLPLSTVDGNRYQSVIEKLRLPITSARQVQNLVNVYEAGQVPHPILLCSFWSEYARRMGWPAVEETYGRMTGWLLKRI